MRISDWSSDVCSSDLCANACAWPTATPPISASPPISPTAWPPPSRCRQAPPRTTAMSTDTDASTAPTCVIAEDEEILRSALESLLREAWPELSIVASCDDGGSAVEAIADNQPDVAFLDIRMPGLTGLAVAQAAAATRPRTPGVFVTAIAQ